MSAHPPAWRRPSSRRFALLAVCLYAGVLVAIAGHHHALASGQSSSHCTICQVVSIVRPQTPPPVVPALEPAGPVSLEAETRGVAVSRRVLTGRSPPPVC